ncbi:MAG: hypothetical protein JO363_18745, partial [Solirubrobacterales bacterium]|nr:hypothetical protein [Solirubrobacterales bacterium]
MTSTKPHDARHARRRVNRLLAGLGCRLLAGLGCALSLCVAASTAQADGWEHHGNHRPSLIPGNLLLGASDYTPADITPG